MSVRNCTCGCGFIGTLDQVLRRHFEPKKEGKEVKVCHIDQNVPQGRTA